MVFDEGVREPLEGKVVASTPGEGSRLVTRRLQIQPLTPDRWNDFVELFGANGACGGCWCMWFRQTSDEFRRRSGASNRRAMKAIVDQARVPGLLGYRDGRVVGWVSLAPREEFGRIERSRVLRRVDESPVWSVVCFYVRPADRGSGVAASLLQAAARHARAHGAKALEGYPRDTDRVSNASAYVGVASMFRSAGFEEVARNSPTRPIMRLRLTGSRDAGRKPSRDATKRHAR